ncbi:hypothetical protein [Tenuibacillus multivorans]|uniref:hypothetical protein n=1 Tax=Tenuibacillus multivorans TaxID=237069 RepID=UPI001C99E7A8|nr:hypothetical protein [Tenuibacillus multivorans]
MGYLLTHHLYNISIFLLLMTCAYFLLKPIILMLVKKKCTYTLSYLVVSVTTSVVILIGIVLTNPQAISGQQRFELLGALWISIIIIGLIFLCHYIAKSLSQHIKNKNTSKL